MDQISLYSNEIYLANYYWFKLPPFTLWRGVQRNHFWIFTIFLSIAKNLMSREKTNKKKCETSCTDSLNFKCHEIISLFQKLKVVRNISSYRVFSFACASHLVVSFCINFVSVVVVVVNTVQGRRFVSEENLMNQGFFVLNLVQAFVLNSLAFIFFQIVICSALAANGYQTYVWIKPVSLHTW